MRFEFSGPWTAGIEFDSRGPVEDLRELSRALGDLRPTWRKAASLTRKSFAENFRQGGRPEAWKPLTPNTLAQKSEEGLEQGFPYATMRGRIRIRRLQQMRGGKMRRSLQNILIARGDLRDSYVQKTRNHHSSLRHEGFEEGSKHPLAEYHEEGTKPYQIRPKRKGGRLRFTTIRGKQFAVVVNHPGLPARPVALIQKEDEEAIMDLLKEHVDPS